MCAVVCVGHRVCIRNIEYMHTEMWCRSHSVKTAAQLCCAGSAWVLEAANVLRQSPQQPPPNKAASKCRVLCCQLCSDGWCCTRLYRGNRARMGLTEVGAPPFSTHACPVPSTRSLGKVYVDLCLHHASVSPHYTLLTLSKPSPAITQDAAQQAAALRTPPLLPL